LPTVGLPNNHISLDRSSGKMFLGGKMDTGVKKGDLDLASPWPSLQTAPNGNTTFRLAHGL
jgi:hypothetical protein